MTTSFDFGSRYQERGETGGWKDFSMYIALAHELCGHALRGNNGLLLGRSGPGIFGEGTLEEGEAVKVENKIRMEKNITCRT
jgi:hypothetical protein